MFSKNVLSLSLSLLSYSFSLLLSLNSYFFPRIRPYYYSLTFFLRVIPFSLFLSSFFFSLFVFLFLPFPFLTLSLCLCFWLSLTSLMSLNLSLSLSPFYYFLSWFSFVLFFLSLMSSLLALSLSFSFSVFLPLCLPSFYLSLPSFSLSLCLSFILSFPLFWFMSPLRCWRLIEQFLQKKKLFFFLFRVLPIVVMTGLPPHAILRKWRVQQINLQAPVIFSTWIHFLAKLRYY